MILDSNPAAKIAQLKLSPAALEIRERGDAAEIAEHAAFELGAVFTETELRKRTDLTKETCDELISALTADGRLLQLLPGRYISPAVLASLGQRCTRLLEDYHTQFPLRADMSSAELRQKLIPGADIADAGAVLQALCDSGLIRLSETGAALIGHTVSLSPGQSRIRDKVFETLSAAGYDTPSPDELATAFAKSDRDDFEQVLESLASGGELVAVSQQVVWLRTAFEEAAGRLRGHFENNKEITLAQCRDLLGTSRKYALAFLEYLDGRRVTRKQGDVRVIDRGFDRLFREDK